MQPSSIFASRGETLGRTIRDLIPLGLCFLLMIAVSFLPPDTSMEEVDRLGRINVCMPADYPPLVTGNAEEPGFEVELVREIANRAGWRLGVVSNASMGRDFNPRSWRLTRAQCQMMAGGIALTATTRSFMDTAEGHLQTGWMSVSAQEAVQLQATTKVGFFAGLTGLDRIGLGQYLRGLGVQTSIVPSTAAMRQGLEDGTFDVVVSEALIAASTFPEDEWTLDWMPEPLERFELGFGFWRGDMTLQRRVSGILGDLQREGFVDQLAERYGIDPTLLCHAPEAQC